LKNKCNIIANKKSLVLKEKAITGYKCTRRILLNGRSKATNQKKRKKKLDKSSRPHKSSCPHMTIKKVWTNPT